MPRQRLAILGATGSIGVSTLDVVARHPDRYEVFGRTAQRRIDELLAQCVQFRPRIAVVPDAAAAARLREGLVAAGLGTEVAVGAQALCDLAAHPEVDSVMAAIVGAAGLAVLLLLVPATLALGRRSAALLAADRTTRRRNPSDPPA